MKDLKERIGQLVWTDELIRAFWDAVGCTHLDDLSFGKIAGPKFLQLIKEHVPLGAETCDFGAGGGHLAELLLKAGFATGVYEPSPGRAEALSAKLSGYHHFLGVTGPDESRQFDVVIMTEVIEHVPDRALGPTLERVRRLLRPSGIAIVTTPNDENISQARVLCPVCRQIFHPWQHLRSFTHDSLGGLLRTYGFAGRFVGLVDFSDDATAIDRSHLLTPLIEFLRCLGRELTEFERHLPPDDVSQTQNRCACSIYGTDNLQFDHRLVLAKIAEFRSQTKTQICEISWPGGEEALRVAVTHFCDEFYSRLGSLIRDQQRRAQIQAQTQELLTAAQQSQTNIEQLRSVIFDIVGQFRSVEQAISDMGMAARLEQKGLGFLRSPGSKLYWTTRFCWEFLRHPALLAEIISMPSFLADQTQAVSAIGRGAGPSVPEKTKSRVPDAALDDGVRPDEIAGGIYPSDKTAVEEMSGATAAVCAHLDSIAERLQHALRHTFAQSQTEQRALLGYDVYLGRGSNILYIGEKM